MSKGSSSFVKMMTDACTSFYNTSSSAYNDSYCPSFFDRIACWPPTEAGTHRNMSCPTHIFPHAAPDAYATRFCTNQSRWEDRAHYALCIGCSPDVSDPNVTVVFSIPPNYIITRKYFIICANGLSIIMLTIGISILLGNSRLRRCSRNILHVNIFLVFLIRSIIQLIAEIFMSKGYFSHNVFERIDACNRTTTYFKEDKLLDCKLFTILMNYINSGASHWFVFCEAFYLYRLLSVHSEKDPVHWYIITGWLAPLYLTIITYATRYILKKDLFSCWFEPSIYDWILHGPNVVLQILNFLIFNYICILLARKLNKTYRTSTFNEQRRFTKYSRLTRSTLILLPLFGIHYFLFMWNTKPLLISNLILIHLTVHTIASSLQGLIVALIYTIINSEVQREVLRSLERCLMLHYSSWQQPNFIRNYINKLDDDQMYSGGYHPRSSSTTVQYRPTQSSILIQHYRCTNRDRFSVSNQSRHDSLCTTNGVGQNQSLLNSTENHG